MPELDELLRAAATGAAGRTKPADFEALVRGARRRRVRPVVIGAGALAACVAIGTVVAVENRAAAPAPPSAVVVAPPDPVLAPLLVDVPVITWTPDPGRSAASVVGGDRAFADAVGGAGYVGGNTTGEVSRFSLDPQLEEAGITGPWVIPANVDSMAELRAIAARLRDVPGIRDAEVTTVRGMRFTVTVRARLRAGEKEGGNVLLGQPGITWGASTFKTRAGGVRDWTMNAYYLGAPVDRAALDRLRSLAAGAWHIRPDQVIVTPQPLRD